MAAETRQRLFLRARLSAGTVIDLDRTQSNYLINVLRMEKGDALSVFNGQDGQWRAVLSERNRRTPTLSIEKLERDQTERPDLYYLFAPLKQGRLDYMVQKAVEMGAGLLTPVLTQHTQVGRVNSERMEANAIEAAEQCGLLSIPQIDEPIALAQLLEAWPSVEPSRRIVYCDEAAPDGDAVAVLRALKEDRFAVLVGPEGGFSEAERQDLRDKPFVTPISLGPRILRADTAAVAAIALIQAVVGDWRREPAT
ncbi:MAG: 16S rRNA (uracil(1498)-N(3))-methyltransferase [Bauldia sp.]